MADDSFSTFEEQFAGLTKTIRRKIDQLKLKYDAELVREVETDFDDASKKLDDINRDVSRHYEFTVAEKAKKRIKALTDQVSEMREELEGTKPTNQNAAAESKRRGRADRDNVRGKLLEGKRIVDDTGQMLDNTERVIAETHAVGAATMQQLHGQGKQIKDSIQTLHQTDSILGRSKKVLIQMRRRVVTNKLLTGFILLLEVGICVLIIYLKYYN